MGSHIADLPTALRDWGVKVVEDYGPGVAGSGWQTNTFEGCMGHHTAGGTSSLTPSLYICKHGRSDVPGPLCQGYLGRDLVARLFTKAWANHPGAGGPLTLGNITLPRDNARPYMVGWEIEHAGTSAEKWTEETIDTSMRCFAATLQTIGKTPAYYCEHCTWAPDRKIDRYTFCGKTALTQTRTDLSTLMSGHYTKEEEDDMEYKDWSRGSKDALLNDIIRWAIPAVPVKVHGSKGKTERFEDTAHRVTRIENTLTGLRDLILAGNSDLAKLVAESDQDGAS